MQITSPAVFIRVRVFGFDSQRAFAEALGYEQPTVSRWENAEPFSSEAQRRIRALAVNLNVDWDNNWFFEVPAAMSTDKPTQPTSMSTAA